MKIMISQPMGYKSPERIKWERQDLVKELQEQGHYVVDTIFTEEAPKNCDEAMYYLAKSIEVMAKVDAVIFMRGWQDARGCKIEHQIALEYGKFVKEV